MVATASPLDGSKPLTEISQLAEASPVVAFAELHCGVNYDVWGMACNGAGCSDKIATEHQMPPCAEVATAPHAPVAVGPSSALSSPTSVDEREDFTRCAPHDEEDAVRVRCKGWCTESDAQVCHAYPSRLHTIPTPPLLATFHSTTVQEHCLFCNCKGCSFCSALPLAVPAATTKHTQAEETSAGYVARHPFSPPAPTSLTFPQPIPTLYPPSQPRSPSPPPHRSIASP